MQQYARHLAHHASVSCDACHELKWETILVTGGYSVFARLVVPSS